MIKKLFLTIFCLCFLISTISIIESQTLGKTIDYVEFDYSSKKVSKELDGFVIGFVTDTHAMTEHELDKVVEKINSRGVNILLIGGDFLTHGENATNSIRALSKTQTITKINSSVLISGVDSNQDNASTYFPKNSNAIFGVDGNHDNAELTFATMREYNILPLDNSGLEVVNGLFLGGVQDLWKRKPDVQKAIQKNNNKNNLVVLLSHNPDVSMEYDTQGVDLMLSGHTHGGQVTLIGLWKPAISGVSRFSNLFNKNFVKANKNAGLNIDVLVSNGTGYIKTAPRVFARPQVYFITLKSQK